MRTWARVGRRDLRRQRIHASHGRRLPTEGSSTCGGTPFELCRWPFGGLTTLPLAWSDEMAYIVGLTATDGCLITGRRVINFKSEDRQLVQTYLGVLGRTNRIRREKTHTPDGVVFTTQFGDSRLYEWFRSTGLTPRKSLTLGSIRAPSQFIIPLARGLMDGDGSIANFVHAPTVMTYPDYRYERLIVSFNSEIGRASCR